MAKVLRCVGTNKDRGHTGRFGEGGLSAFQRPSKALSRGKGPIDGPGKAQARELISRGVVINQRKMG